MKFNFKKIVSVFASTVMLSSTLALAAAANAPAPFVQGGVANAAVVVGSSPLAADDAAAQVVKAYLDSQVTNSGSTSTSTVTGDSVQLGSGSDKFNLGDDTNDFLGGTLDDEDLSTVLAEGTYENDDGDEFDYKQTITLPANALTHFVDDDLNDDERPVIGFDLASNAAILNYTLEFVKDADGGAASSSDEFPDLSDTYIDIMGKNYYISDVEYVASGADVVVTLLDSANELILNKGEAQSITIGDKTYNAELTFVHSTNGVKLTVNGEDTGLLQAGNTKKLSDGTYVSILENLAGEDADADSAKISIGTGKVELTNGAEVELNGELISDIDAYEDQVVTAWITNSSATEIGTIVLQWTISDDNWVTSNRSLVLPGFNTVKWSMGSFVFSGSEETTIDDNSDSVRLSTTVKDGDVDFSILYANAAVTSFAGLGEDSGKVLVTNATTTTPAVLLNESEDSYFVATWISGDDAESYVFQIGSITNSTSVNNSVTLKNLANNENVVIGEIGDDEELGNVKLTVTTADDSAGTALITIDKSGSSGTVYADRLVTKTGLTIELPVQNSSIVTAGANNQTNSNQIGLLSSGNYTAFALRFQEENSDDQIASGGRFNVTVGIDSGDGTEPTAIGNITTFDKEKGSDIDVGYHTSALSTYVEYTNPSGDDLNEVTLTYAGEETYAEVFVAEASATISGGSSGILIVQDNEADMMSGKNLVVVGGSCINTVAATLLGSSSPLCGSAWESATGAGAGSFVINSYAYGGKIATLVAGYNQADTLNAANYLKNHASSVDTSDGKEYLGTNAETASLVVQ